MNNQASQTFAKKNFFEVIVFWLVAAAAVFSKNIVFIDAVSLGDLLFLVALIAILVRNLQNGILVRANLYSISLSAFLIVAFLSGLCRTISSPLMFSEEKFLRSVLKLAFYIAGTVLVIGQLRNISKDRLAELMMQLLTIGSLVALYIYTTVALELPLPYKFLWYGQTDLGEYTIYYRQTDLIAAKGFFVEPSLLGMFNAFGLAFVFMVSKKSHELIGWRLAVIVCALILSLSLSGYMLLFGCLVLLLLSSRNIRLICLFSGFIFASIFSIFLSDVLQEVLVLRLTNSIAGIDNSSSARIMGSWDVALRLLAQTPFFGVGLGNFDFAQQTLSASFYDIGSGDQGWNILAYILATTGVLGFLVFAVGILAQLVGAPLLTIVFIATMFCTGAFLETMFWFFYILVALVASKQKSFV